MIKINFESLLQNNFIRIDRHLYRLQKIISNSLCPTEQPINVQAICYVCHILH